MILSARIIWLAAMENVFGMDISTMAKKAITKMLACMGSMNR